ncbi:AraC family transcriptional regulator [Paenibacillus sp. SYP-B4298]|uniref:AraC family transcriptional regulator n=1 Tax=Paenibacillus sp. SYP-B4298 TaxID=2996034 RepID=UPI0022DD018C|nr:AraC family transcriptional regulator [Paenibacillus sp. SYP-B4298]
MTQPWPHRRIAFSLSAEQSLPIIVESIGLNDDQEPISRPEGFPLYHWLQTMEGEGELSLGGHSIPLPQHSGILLPPGVPHSYAASSARWETMYLTFGGIAAPSMLASLGMQEAAFFRWERDSICGTLLLSMLERLESVVDMFGLEASIDAYRFLGTLSKFGRLHQNTSVQRNVEKLQPLIEWMEQHYGNPAIGLDDLAAVLGISGRYLSTLFNQTFGVSPYGYLIHVRLRKAKERLIGGSACTVARIAGEVGFRDVSHFVATFRRTVGMTPEQFRNLH